MAASSSQLSFVTAIICAVLTFSGMQIYKTWFVSSHLNHIIGGYVGTLLFIFVFTAVCNLEACMFGNSYQAKLFPEVIFCLLTALFSTLTLHRVCVTSCLIFSLSAVYYINGYSQKVHGVAAQSIPASAHAVTNKKKN